MTTPKPKNSGGEPPPTMIIFITYSILGLILSYAFGPDSSETNRTVDYVTKELAPTIAIICLFGVSYSLLDVMGVGIIKAKHGIGDKAYTPSMVTNVPEEVYIAQRIQTNQVEQLPSFIVASLSFSFFVNANVGAVLTAVWVVLRRLYAVVYRSSVGKPLGQSGINRLTIPAYFVLNAMLMGTVVQCIRSL